MRQRKEKTIRGRSKGSQKVVSLEEKLEEDAIFVMGQTLQIDKRGGEIGASQRLIWGYKEELD